MYLKTCAGGTREHYQLGDNRSAHFKLTSWIEPGVELRFAVRYLGSSVGWMDSPGQWSKLAIREPFPVHAEQPIVL